MKKKEVLKIKNKPVGRPKSTLKDNEKVPAAERSTKPGDKRKTFIVNIELTDKIEAIAYIDRVTVKSVVHDAFTSHVDTWEEKNGYLTITKKE